MATRKRSPNFEQSLKQLETIVETLEQGELSLDESLKQFEKGVKISQDCQNALTNAEQRVQVLSEASDEDTPPSPS